jgi:hypothetical protein
MDFVIIPHAVGTDYCTLWLGAFHCERRPEEMVLHITPSRAPVPVATQQWELVYPPDLLPSGGSINYRQAVECRGLEANRTYTLHLQKGPDVLASATVQTLPANLPPLHEEPFTVLLGSCFCQENDEQGDLNQSFSHLPLQDRPSVKILCGDQVYLDHPTVKNFPENSLELAEIFLNKYIRTWRESDSAGMPGLGGLLKHGANYFMSDDHEFWNNYPNRATLIQNSWSELGRLQWGGPAKYLFRQFQSLDPEQAAEPQSFTVPPVSFLILDTRFFRDEGDSTFLPPSHMARLHDWIAELNAQRRVGLLCIGQLLFEEKAGWVSTKFVDRNLADYAQFPDLVEALAESQQPMVILTGDVHYGRVARCRQAHGPDLYEVISSPLSLVDKRVGGSASPPPSIYPTEAIPGIQRVDVSLVSSIDGQPVMTADEHFLTINFWAMGPSVRMQLKYWPVRTGGQRPRPLHTVLIDLLTTP